MPSREAGLWDPFGAERNSGVQLTSWDGAQYVRWAWDQWRDASLQAAAGLRHAGIEEGSRVACVLTNSPETCAGVLAMWLAGAMVLSLPTIARGMRPSAYLEHLRAICHQARPQLFLADDTLAGALAGVDIGAPVRTFADLPRKARFDPTPPRATEGVFVQYSSGSTGDPRGCVLTAEAIATQLTTLAEALAVDASADRIVSWLPLSHDMGMFGCLLMSYWTGTPLTLGTPERFLTRPSTWFEDCAIEQATMTVGPNFAFDLAARVSSRRMPAPFPMRAAVVGGERVRPETLDRVHRTMGDARFPSACLVSAYGLAEGVLAVTTTRPGTAPAVVELDAAALQGGALRPATGDRPKLRLASAGTPLASTDLWIREPWGDAGPGEVCVRSRSMASCYLGLEELTERAFVDGALRTGDYGFLDSGELFLVGRADDMVAIGGRNVYVGEVEHQLGGEAGLRRGCCAVVDIPEGDGTRFVVVAELSDEATSPEGLARRLGRVARRNAALPISACHFLPKGCLPKTPSGKIARFRCRQLALDPPDGARNVAL